MFCWQVILQQILWEFLSPCVFTNIHNDNRKPFFSVIRSSDTTVLGPFRGTWKERMTWPRFFIIILSLFCRGNDAVLQRRGRCYHPLQIASSVQAGVIPWASGNYRWLHYKGDAHHIAADGSGSISIITLYYQVEKTRLGKKCIQE